MKNREPSLFLWILCGLIILSLATIAVIDRVSHPGTQPASALSQAVSPDLSTAKVGTRIGLTAPDFTLPTTGEKEFKLSDYRGRNVILNFWATWCGPCRFEVPALKALQDKYNDGSIAIVAVNTLDNADSARSYAADNGLNFVIPIDPRGDVSSLYNIRGMPTTLFINAKGIITSIKIGPFISMEEIEDRMSSFN
jgi:thiol-disulfide isomerase/thioredoxin